MPDATLRSNLGGAVHAQRQRGIVLLAMRLALAILGVFMMAAADVWQVTRQRERERELLFVGHQYRNAIRSYLLAAPPGGRAATRRA